MRYRLGMVLSGGGARGLGHVGVLAALAEQGIQPDVAAGTSAGSIVAALWAAGYSPDEMLEFFVEKNPFRLSKLALSKPGFFDTEKVLADFRQYFPEDSFEALKKPVYLTATDLIEGKAEIFASGPLIPRGLDVDIAVRAAMAASGRHLVRALAEVDGQLGQGRPD